MRIVLFILNKETRNLAAHINIYSHEYEYITGETASMENEHDAVIRIAMEEIGLTLQRSKLKFIRRESSSVLRGRDTSVNSLTTFVYECKGDEFDLSNTCYEWFDVSDILSDMCDRNKYFEAAYLSEACEVAQKSVSL